jgi:hypothetical protein
MEIQGIQLISIHFIKKWRSKSLTKSRAQEKRITTTFNYSSYLISHAYIDIEIKMIILESYNFNALTPKIEAKVPSKFPILVE